MRKIAEIVAFITICFVPLEAQWPKYQTTGVPREADSRVHGCGASPRREGRTGEPISAAQGVGGLPRVSRDLTAERRLAGRADELLFSCLG